MNFNSFQNILNTAIAESREKIDYSKQDKNTKLPLSDAFFCGEDILKNKRFFEALKLAISDLKKIFPSENISVIDAGSGTGVLGILALIAGADKVLFIEANAETLDWSKSFIENLGYSDQSEFILGDAGNTQLDKKYHLIISETLTVDFGREDFHKIIKNLKKFLLPNGIIIPESCEINFLQQDFNKKILSKNTISRNFGEDISEYTLDIHKNTETLEISGTLGLYGDIKISSGESISLFNTLELSKSELEDKFTWASEE